MYVIATASNYWGKGETALEAAKNANVGGKWVNAIVTRINQEYMADEFEVNPIDGSVSVFANDNVIDVYKEHKAVRQMVRDACFLGQGRMKILKGKVIFEREL